ncbi:carbon-nitrogen hydrolase family protein [candidate division KSB1 bacterium]
MAEVAKKQNCYIVCPIITKKEGRVYNSSILIDRKGEIAGIYHKVHPTDGEVLRAGITPGEIKPPVFKTDFGTIGMQICYDGDFFDSWGHLKKQGAEIVLFSSQAPFRDILRYHAWMNHYYITASTGEYARIIDISGDIISDSGSLKRWVCAPVNLEKVLIHTWSYLNRLEDIRKKYRKRINIKILHDENWATIESLDAGIQVNDILEEYEIPTYDKYIRENEEIQNKYRV